MKKILLIIAGIILFLFISVNVTSALSPKLAEAILGLPFGDQILLIAQKVDEQEAKLDEQTSRVNELEQQLEAEKAKNATLEAELTQTKESNEMKFNQQQACIKASELSQIPTNIKLRTAGESGGNGCGPSNTKFIPSSTEGALNYLQGWMQHYKDTGSQTWQHSPDVCLYDAQNALPILEQRFADYQKQKDLCGN